MLVDDIDEDGEPDESEVIENGQPNKRPRNRRGVIFQFGYQPEANPENGGTGTGNGDSQLISNYKMSELSRVSNSPTVSDSVREQDVPNDAAIRVRLPVVKHKRFNRPKKLTRKRKIDEPSWIDVSAKRARSAGLSGIGRKNKPIKERKMGQGCTEVCRLSCREKISEEERKAASDCYWALADKAAQWRCIFNWIIQAPVQNSAGDDEWSGDEAGFENLNTNPQRRKHIIHYRLPSIGGSFTRSCKKTFLDCLGMYSLKICARLEVPIQTSNSSTRRE